MDSIKHAAKPDRGRAFHHGGALVIFMIIRIVGRAG
jgi:hypothetical protein